MSFFSNMKGDNGLLIHVLSDREKIKTMKKKPQQNKPNPTLNLP